MRTRKQQKSVNVRFVVLHSETTALPWFSISLFGPHNWKKFFVRFSDSILEILSIIERTHSRQTVRAAIKSCHKLWNISWSSCWSRRPIQFGSRLHWAGVRSSAHRRVCLWNVQNAKVYSCYIVSSSIWERRCVDKMLVVTNRKFSVRCLS